MRHKGCDSEFKEQRDAEILALYRKYVASEQHIHSGRMLRFIVNSPSSRFWITEQRCAIVLGRMKKGDDFPNVYPEKMNMYRELYRRAELIWKEHPDMAVSDVSSIIIEQPAPSFYMSTRLCNLIITRAKKRAWLKERKKKLYFSCM